MGIGLTCALRVARCGLLHSCTQRAKQRRFSEVYLWRGANDAQWVPVPCRLQVSADLHLFALFPPLVFICRQDPSPVTLSHPCSLILSLRQKNSSHPSSFPLSTQHRASPMRKLWEFLKRSSSSPKRGRNQEPRLSSSKSAERLSEIRTPTKITNNSTLLTANHPYETPPVYLHSTTYAMPFSSAPALVQTSSTASAPTAHLPFSDFPPPLPTSPLHLSDTPLSSNTPRVTPVITTTLARSYPSRPSSAGSTAASTRSAPPRIRIDRNASPARPETRNNVAPFVSNPALLAPKPMDRPIVTPTPMYSVEFAERRASHIPGGNGKSYIPGGVGTTFLPGTGDVGIGSGMGMGSGMGLAGITSRPGSSGSTSSRRERRQSTHSYRSARRPPVLIDPSEPGPFAHSGKATWRARVKTFE